MKLIFLSSLLCITLSMSSAAHGQLPVSENAQHELMLASSDQKLASNKRLVYDFWREVFEAGHVELAEKYLADNYIQHNPNVPTGRVGFVEFFKRFAKPKVIAPRVKAPLVSIVAEGNLVVLSFVSEEVDTKDPSKKYTTTWFDMFRIEDGKIAEHWDPAKKL